jgi:hypothetical protein
MPGPERRQGLIPGPVESRRRVDLPRRHLSGARHPVGTATNGLLNVTICPTRTLVRKIVGTPEEYRDTVPTITASPPGDRTVPVVLILVPNDMPVVRAVPGNLDGDRKYGDVNDNDQRDFADVVLYIP